MEAVLCRPFSSSSPFHSFSLLASSSHLFIYHNLSLSIIYSISATPRLTSSSKNCRLFGADSRDDAHDRSFPFSCLQPNLLGWEEQRVTNSDSVGFDEVQTRFGRSFDWSGQFWKWLSLGRLEFEYTLDCSIWSYSYLNSLNSFRR